MTTTKAPTQAFKGVKPITRKQARFAFIVLLVINILNYADRSILGAVQTKIQPEFGLTDTELGFIISSFLLIYGLATFPLGIWADRGIRKNIVAACVGIWSIATALAGFTHNFIQLLLTRSALGIGEAGYAPASLSMIGDYFPKSVRGRMLSLWSIGNVVGTAIGQITGGIIAVTLGWRWAFFFVGIPGLIMAFLIWRAVEPTRGAFDQSDTEEGAEEVAESAMAGHGSLGTDIWQKFKVIGRIPTFWILLGSFIASFFIVGAATGWITTYIIRDFHLTEGQAGTVSGLTLAIGSIIGTILGGWLGDALQKRMPQGRLLISTIAFLAGAPLTLLALSFHDLYPFIGVFILAIVALSLCLGPINAVIQDIIEPDMRATATGLLLLIAHLLGDAASPIIIGIIADHTSLGTALITTAPTCLFIAGLICLIGLKTVARDMQAMQERMRRAQSAQ
ncbi:spinster family MFS transporter [Ktedonospora formicarum]|uniref:MFS transporter n=1 Tax=Ktedonospora formicarum TaxID=2778364 RepID=A0A8J3IF88_9CHLR|nr:MFS transporter [Ktedonospora formicarum]GHO50124.1 MFS transporter [Ktedonospora formicarum]